MPQHGTIHDSLFNAFSFGLFAAYELESEDRLLLQKPISEWRSRVRCESPAASADSSPGLSDIPARAVPHNLAQVAERRMTDRM